ncbi:MAG: AraC family transcriptional regulator [Bacteroidota bacterium]
MEITGTQSTEIINDIEYSRSIEDLKTWIDNHLYDHHSLRTLAERAGMSITRMQRLFRDLHGCSIFAYIRFERLVRAQNQLEVTAMNIKSISAEAGYGSVPAFTAAFHSAFGYTPGRYRKRIK